MVATRAYSAEMYTSSDRDDHGRQIAESVIYTSLGVQGSSAIISAATSARIAAALRPEHGLCGARVGGGRIGQVVATPYKQYTEQESEACCTYVSAQSNPFAAPPHRHGSGAVNSRFHFPQQVFTEILQRREQRILVRVPTLDKRAQSHGIDLKVVAVAKQVPKSAQIIQ